MEEKDKEIRKLYDSNKELLTYIDYLEINRGKDVAHSTRKSRTLNTFMSRAQIALWFMESFGLKMKGITASFYHELTMFIDGLAKYYLIKQRILAM